MKSIIKTTLLIATIIILSLITNILLFFILEIGTSGAFIGLQTYDEAYIAYKMFPFWFIKHI